MNRREAIKNTSVLLGGAISLPTMSVLLQGCEPERCLKWNPILFSTDQAMIIEDLCELILPKTDTLGAQELGVPQFLEKMVNEVYDDKTKKRFMDGLTAFEAESLENFSRPFIECDHEDQYIYLKPLNDEVVRLGQEANNTRGGVKEPPFFMMVKELTIVGYCRSEYGASEFLQYQAVPGAYNGCISLDEAGGKTWAT